MFTFSWSEKIGFPEKPYLVRWVVDLHGFSIRLHHWFSSDDTRHPHDHTWWFVVLVLKGGYTDATPIWKDGILAGWNLDRLRAGSIRFRRPEHQHCVVIPQGQTNWSLLITGPNIRRFGFWLKETKWVKASKYFFTKGHHPPVMGWEPRRTIKKEEGLSIGVSSCPKEL